MLSTRVLHYAAPGAKRAAQRATQKKAAADRGGRDATKDQQQAFLDKHVPLLLRPVIPPKRTPEEQVRLRALMIKYGKFKRKEWLESEMKKNRFTLAKLKALNALPVARRIEALNEEKLSPPPPLNRPLWTHTPPIKGFSLANLTESAAEKTKKEQKQK